MGTLFFSILIATGVVLVCAVLFAFWRKNRALVERVSGLRQDLSRTSKILIEKNLELVDQNISQQKLLESKDDFINIVSHQLRTPITEMKWSIDTMLKNAQGTLEAGQRKSLETLYASTEHSIRLINDIVHLVAVEQGAQHIAVVAYSPDEVVRLAAEAIAQSLGDKHIELSMSTTCAENIDSIDSDSLHMVVSNLVENAFYYSSEGDKVAVHTECSKEGAYMVTVKDSGIGMSVEQQKAVFTKFRRSTDAIQANVRGSGLGLYIVKKIVEYHKGTISFESAEHVGTVFTLMLPKVTHVVVQAPLAREQ